ncbi:MAG: HAD family hydrolase [Candidatus Tectimicrobiota bacterium]
MKLVLFDIDGTLVSTGAAGADAMRLALAELCGVPDGFAGIEMSGKTDPLILQEALTRHCIDAAAVPVEVFYERYIPRLRATLQETHRPRRLMPGVTQLLETLATQSDLVLGLLTGNVALGAQLKLESFGIWHYFRLGAYGSDHSDRNALVPVAQQRAQALLGQSFAPEQVYVIGDTPRDIACAHAHGARAVAVATGRYAVEELRRHQPEHCFADLSAIDTVVRIFRD